MYHTCCYSGLIFSLILARVTALESVAVRWSNGHIRHENCAFGFLRHSFDQFQVPHECVSFSGPKPTRIGAVSRIEAKSQMEADTLIEAEAASQIEATSLFEAASQIEASLKTKAESRIESAS